MKESTMSAGIVLVDSSEVRPGVQDQLESTMSELVDFIRASASRVLYYNMYLSDDGRLMTVVQVHPDSESVEVHMQLGAPIFARFADLLTMSAIDVYGEPSPTLMEQLRRKGQTLGRHAPIRVHRLQAGFNRIGPT